MSSAQMNNVDITPSTAGVEGIKEKWTGSATTTTMKARPRSNSTQQQCTIEEQMVDLFRPPIVGGGTGALSQQLNAIEETFLNDQRVVEPNVVEADLAAKFDKTTMNVDPQVSIFSRCWLRACAVGRERVLCCGAASRVDLVRGSPSVESASSASCFPPLSVAETSPSVSSTLLSLSRTHSSTWRPP